MIAPTIVTAAHDYNAGGSPFTCKAHITAEGNIICEAYIICPTGQTSLKKARPSVLFSWSE